MSDSSGLESWLRLSLAAGVGQETQRSLLTAFGLPEAVFASGCGAIAARFGPKIAEALFDDSLEPAIAAGLEWAEKPGNRLLSLADPDYPPQLLQSPYPPTLLYLKGRAELLARDSLAIVGSRDATAQGIANAEAFAEALSRTGLAIVSGLALGIDAAAHRGALRGDGGTIALIGTGADRIYPARNADLAREIAERGVIVSEFPLGTPPLRANFPRRNRLIAGLARGTLVVEAALQSGSLITARLAGDQGRDVFAIPGSIHSPLSKGCHQLIREGAKLVESAQDIAEEFGWAKSLEPVAASAPAASADEERLLAAMGFDPVDADTLCERGKLTPDALFAMLLALELAGRVARLPGGRFARLS